jgi:hypothetical protein
MRHTLEHWDHHDERKGRWKTLAENYGENASPWTVVGVEAPDDTDLLIGPDAMPLQKLEQALVRARDELLEVYTWQPDMINLDEVLARARDELLELHPGEPELKQVQARARENILKLYIQELELLERYAGEPEWEPVLARARENVRKVLHPEELELLERDPEEPK